MSNMIKIINDVEIEKNSYSKKYVGCLVLTSNNKIMLQKRGHDWPTYPNYLCEFGGGIEKNEKPLNAIIRELHEELGAIVNQEDIISIAAVTESMSNFQELIYTFFWHDKLGTIKGCFEGEAKYFDAISDILVYPNITDGLRWLLAECQNRNLIE